MLSTVLLLSCWTVLMLFLIYQLGQAIGRFVWFILRAIPLLGCVAHLILGMTFLPWVLLHELCHALMLKLAGGKIKKIWLFPAIAEGGLELGSVIPAEMGSPMFWGFVGVAPLLLGVVAINLLLRYGFGIPWVAMMPPPEQFWQTLWNMVRRILGSGNGLMLYLFFMLGNGMMPSLTDWKMALQMFVSMLLVLIVAGAAVIGVSFNVVSQPVYVDLWLALLTMIAIQCTLVAAMDFSIWLILVLPGSLAMHIRQGNP